MNPDGNTHVVPTDDLIEHIESTQCECQPKLHYRDLGTAKEVWTHNRLKDALS
jgi:hypothetical protein